MDKNYVKGKLTVIWKSHLCTHSGNCVRGLKDVFDPQRRPWIDLNAAEQDQIIAQVKKCPSGALSYTLEGENIEMTSDSPAIQIVALPNGPLQVNSTCQVTLPSGEKIMREDKSFFCRCGASSNKPFCDGSHKKAGFQDQTNQ